MTYLSYRLSYSTLHLRGHVRVTDINNIHQENNKEPQNLLKYSNRVNVYGIDKANQVAGSNIIALIS